MISSKVFGEFENVIKSDGFDMLSRGIMRSFKTDEDFAYWVFSGGANLYSYIKAVEDKTALEELVSIITDVLRDNLSKEELKKIKSDKTAFKFVSKWLKSLGQKEEESAKLKHLSSGKRNLYSHFLCILLNYTKIEDEAKLTDEEIKEQEFEMVSTEDLDKQETATEIIEA